MTYRIKLLKAAGESSQLRKGFSESCSTYFKIGVPVRAHRKLLVSRTDFEDIGVSSLSFEIYTGYAGTAFVIPDYVSFIKHLYKSAPSHLYRPNIGF
jgi:hypothetical protein